VTITRDVSSERGLPQGKRATGPSVVALTAFGYRNNRTCSSQRLENRSSTY